MSTSAIMRNLSGFSLFGLRSLCDYLLLNNRLRWRELLSRLSHARVLFNLLFSLTYMSIIRMWKGLR
jgi:hypothetical protein